MWRRSVVLGLVWIAVLVGSIAPQLDPYGAPDGTRLLSGDFSTTWDMAFTLADGADTRDIVCGPGKHGMSCWLPCTLAIQWLDDDRSVGPRFERQEPSSACEIVPMRERDGCRTVIAQWHRTAATDADRWRWVDKLCPQFDPSWVDT